MALLVSSSFMELVSTSSVAFTRELLLFIGIEDQVEWIERELRSMQSLLEHVEAIRQPVEDEINWASKARDVFEEAENKIDVYLRKIAKYRRRGAFRRSFFVFHHLIVRLNLYLKVKKIKVQIRDVSKRRPKQPQESLSYQDRSLSQAGPSTFHEPPTPHEAATAVASVIGQVNSVMSQNLLVLSNQQDNVGFYEDLQAVVALLLTNNEYRSIISIVGMEGIGKTTLAKLVYENIDVTQHFTCKAWVPVHSDCDVEALMRCIREQLWERLPPVPMLIVLDDVSTTEIWDRLIKEFPSTLNGSRIVLTTRDVDVATHADPNSVHNLRLLSDVDSWALFTKRLTVPPEFLPLLRKMVMRCGGLPRAVVQLREQFAGTESTSGAWLAVIDQNPKLDQEPWKKTWDVMYRSLPMYLRRSLFYLGRFPADSDIPLRRLIALWTAEGLVLQRRGDEDPPETVARRYLAELIDRNMVQATKKKLNGEIQKCRLPYALREIWSLPEYKKAAYPESHTNKNSKLYPVVKFIKFLFISELSPSYLHTNTRHKIRHLSHHSEGDGVCVDHLGDTDATNLSHNSLSPDHKYVISFRSFDTQEGSQPGKHLRKFFKDCISSGYLLSLRVLDLERVFRPELPKALGELVLLRYLGLRWTYLEFLPSFIEKLLNLQTLDVKHTSINTLPASIWKMERLRHLYLDEDYRCRFVPRPRDYSLTDLQTLWGLFVDEDSPVKDGLDGLIKLRRLGVMSRLMSASQEAMLSQLEAVANWVQKLKLLQSLRLKSFDKQGKPWQLPKLDLTGHTNLSSLYLLGRMAENNFLVSVLPSALTELTLSGSGLTEDPMPKLGELPHLRILRLFADSFLGVNMFCPPGGFPQLRILKLWKLEQLQEWEVGNGALSDLIDLEIRSCQNLKKLPNELRDSRILQMKFSDMPGEYWDSIRNDRFDFHEDHSVNSGNIAEASIIPWSQIREKLVKPTISRSKKHFLWKIASDELPTGSKEYKMCHKDGLEETDEAKKIASDELPTGSKKCRMRHKERLEETGEAKIASDKLPTGSKEGRMCHKEKLEETGEVKIASDKLPTGSKECPFCGAEPESAVHLFFLCKPIKMIWFAKWGIRTDDFPNLSIADWISNILTPSGIFGESPPNEMEFLTFAVVFMEKIWLWRNKVVTDHVEVDPDKIYQETCSSLMNMLILKE